MGDTYLRYGRVAQLEKRIGIVETRLHKLLDLLEIVMTKKGTILQDHYSTHTHNYDNNGTADETDTTNKK